MPASSLKKGKPTTPPIAKLIDNNKIKGEKLNDDLRKTLSSKDDREYFEGLKEAKDHDREFGLTGDPVFPYYNSKESPSSEAILENTLGEKHIKKINELRPPSDSDCFVLIFAHGSLVTNSWLKTPPTMNFFNETRIIATCDADCWTLTVAPLLPQMLLRFFSDADAGESIGRESIGRLKKLFTLKGLNELKHNPIIGVLGSPQRLQSTDYPGCRRWMNFDPKFIYPLNNFSFPYDPSKKNPLGEDMATEFPSKAGIFLFHNGTVRNITQEVFESKKRFIWSTPDIKLDEIYDYLRGIGCEGFINFFIHACRARSNEGWLGKPWLLRLLLEKGLINRLMADVLNSDTHSGGNKKKRKKFTKKKFTKKKFTKKNKEK